MWDKAKKLLKHCLDILLAFILLVACVSYVGINTILLTEVINDLRLDTYVGLETGFSIVLLILLLGWGPVWLIRTLRNYR